MSKKRFTDIDIWDKDWYMDLKPVHKCLMKYIFDKCDAAGCWKPNWKLASTHINEKVCQDDLKFLPKDQYEILENGKIWIPDFIPFQYGQLSKKSPAHNPVFESIEKNNLSNRVSNRLLNRVSNTLMDKDKDIYKDKDKDKGIVKGMKNGFPILSDFNGLPELKIEASIEMVRISCKKDLTAEEVKSSWEVFKIQNLTGENYYASEEKVYSHFINWIKKQDFKNGTEAFNSSNGKRKLGTSAEREIAARKF